MTKQLTKQLSLRFSNEEYRQLTQLAMQEGIGITAFIKNLALRSINVQPTISLTVADVDTAATPLTSGTEFKIRDLFASTVWNQYSKSSRLSVGRSFYTAVDNGNYAGKYVFVEKDSDNAAVYKRL